MKTNDSCGPRNSASAPPSPDALAAAQANADAIAKQFVDSSNISYEERAALVQDLRIAVARVDAIQQAQR